MTGMKYSRSLSHIMIRYVAGFLFRKNNTEVALVEKQRPKWQKGLHNGIGGKIELGESPEEALVREFREETGWTTTESAWTKYHIINGDDWCVYFYYSFDGDSAVLETVETEIIKWVPVVDVYTNKLTIIHNLKELIQLALEQNLK